MGRGRGHYSLPFRRHKRLSWPSLNRFWVNLWRFCRRLRCTEYRVSTRKDETFHNSTTGTGLLSIKRSPRKSVPDTSTVGSVWYTSDRSWWPEMTPGLGQSVEWKRMTKQVHCLWILYEEYTVPWINYTLSGFRTEFLEYKITHLLPVILLCPYRLSSTTILLFSSVLSLASPCPLTSREYPSSPSRRTSSTVTSSLNVIQSLGHYPGDPLPLSSMFGGLPPLFPQWLLPSPV